ncbi:hypothetical protein SB30_280030 [Klebsiella quasipneumoniae subsp. similipneumoniae]|nr:hypothetical protein SB30_280030 [Klebsiella quasipneumoniae subsp. similipneumoniae]
MSAICPAKSEENSLNPNLLGLLIGPTKSSNVFVGPKRMETPHGKINQAVNRYGDQSRQT